MFVSQRVRSSVRCRQLCLTGVTGDLHWGKIRILGIIMGTNSSHSRSGMLMRDCGIQRGEEGQPVQEGGGLGYGSYCVRDDGFCSCNGGS